jgi:hypothetical protein
MRTTPTATVTGTWTVGNASTPSVAFISPYGASIRIVATATGTLYAYPSVTADAITFSSEL